MSTAFAEPEPERTPCRHEPNRLIRFPLALYAALEQWGREHGHENPTAAARAIVANQLTRDGRLSPHDVGIPAV